MDVVQVVGWTEDDDEVGEINYELFVHPDGSAHLNLNGQGALPIPAEDVESLRIRARTAQ